MKKILLTAINVDFWKKQEKSFVIAMMLIGVFNLTLVILMLNQ